jgi:hypothetical protein
MLLAATYAKHTSDGEIHGAAAPPLRNTISTALESKGTAILRMKHCIVQSNDSQVFPELQMGK